MSLDQMPAPTGEPVALHEDMFAVMRRSAHDMFLASMPQPYRLNVRDDSPNAKAKHRAKKRAR